MLLSEVISGYRGVLGFEKPTMARALQQLRAPGAAQDELSRSGGLHRFGTLEALATSVTVRMQFDRTTHVGATATPFLEL